jgi:hypothetical protein
MGTRKSVQTAKRAPRTAASGRPAVLEQLALGLPVGVEATAAAPVAPLAAPANVPTPPVAPPAHPAAANGPRHGFRDLRAALAEGWEIVQPIFARPLWSAPDDNTTAFSFVLRGPHGTRLITVPQGRSVERFIRARRLAVDYAR